jgi:hypothetical protein
MSRTGVRFTASGDAGSLVLRILRR